MNQPKGPCPPNDVPSPSVFTSKLYFGYVSHRRTDHAAHQFKYKVFFTLLNLDELDILDQGSVLFATNRWGPLSFHVKDHGAKNGMDLKEWLTDKLKEGGYDFPLGPVMLQCFPRIFGFMFNPLSVWYCYDTDGNLRCILYEVRNTFKEWRGYLLPVPENIAPGQRVHHTCDKTFYVSPFIDMDCTYHFTIKAPDDRIDVYIRETHKGKDILHAHQNGIAQPLRSKTIIRALLRHPFLYFKIIMGIHKEAFVTFMKGAKFFSNPRGKTGDITYPLKK